MRDVSQAPPARAPPPLPPPELTCAGRSQSSGSLTRRARPACQRSTASACASSSSIRGDAALLPGVRERAGGRGGRPLPPLRLHHVPLRPQRHAEGDEPALPEAEGGGRRAGRGRRLGERRLDGRAVPEVRPPARLLHAAADALGRRAHDHLLQVLQRPVRPPLEGLTGGTARRRPAGPNWLVPLWRGWGQTGREAQRRGGHHESPGPPGQTSWKREVPQPRMEEDATPGRLSGRPARDGRMSSEDAGDSQNKRTFGETGPWQPSGWGWGVKYWNRRGILAAPRARSPSRLFSRYLQPPGFSPSTLFVMGCRGTKTHQTPQYALRPFIHRPAVNRLASPLP